MLTQRPSSSEAVHALPRALTAGPASSRAPCSRSSRSSASRPPPPSARRPEPAPHGAARRHRRLRAGVGLFYVFMTYSWVIGRHRIRSSTSTTRQLRLGCVRQRVLGHRRRAGWLFFALVNSLIACGTASTNNAARVFFAMGRTGNAPRYLGKVHPRHKSPYLSVVTVLLVTGTVAYALAFYLGDVLGAGTEGPGRVRGRGDAVHHHRDPDLHGLVRRVHRLLHAGPRAAPAGTSCSTSWCR